MKSSQTFFRGALSATQQLFQDNGRFAGLLNGFLFDGRPGLDPAALADIPDRAPLLDAFAGFGPFPGAQPWDAAKRLAGSADYMLLGVDRYAEIDYALPLKVMAYDASQYFRQAEAQTAASGGAKGKLRPRVTVVVYYGKEPWDAPQSLNGMFTAPPAAPFDAGGNAPVIHVLDVKRLTPAQLQKYDAGVRPLLGYLRYADEPDRLMAVLKEDRAFFGQLPTALCDALLTLTGQDALRAPAARHTKDGVTDLYAAALGHFGEPAPEGAAPAPAALFRPDAFRLAYDAPSRCAALLGALLERSDIRLTDVMAGGQLNAPGPAAAPFDLCALDDRGVFYALRAIPAGEPLPPDILPSCRQTDRLLIERLGAGPDDLPEVWNLFLCEKDPFAEKRPKYTLLLGVSERPDLVLDDGSHILLFNGEYRGDDGIGRLMRELAE